SSAVHLLDRHRTKGRGERVRRYAVGNEKRRYGRRLFDMGAILAQRPRSLATSHVWSVAERALRFWPTSITVMSFEPSRLDDLDPQETKEWLESIDSVLKTHGPERAHFLLERLIDYTRRSGAYLPFRPNTAYVNTIPVGQEKEYPGDRTIERRIEAYLRWNAMAMVVQANRQSSEYGGHIATYASAATLYEVGFNHFWRAPSENHPGDMIFIQGHASPGIYARAFLEGRLTEDHL